MTAALIGHTGFVGSSLRNALNFDACFNSKNFRDLVGRQFGHIVCAGFSAAKWIANREPDEDWRRINDLLRVLETVAADEFVLISTIDVYPDPASRADEFSAIDARLNHSYGRHRREIELWAMATFPLARIVRLPALFGTGLKKNAIFDLLNNNQVDKINPASVYQWYPLQRLASDLDTIRREDLRLVNLFTEPLETRSIVDRCFVGAAVGPAFEPAPRYDLRTKYDSLFGGRGGYVMAAHAELEAIGEFVVNERERNGKT